MSPIDTEDTAVQRDIYTVSRLNREVRALLEGNFPPIWIEGEISNFVRPSSGHFYFSLKDASAQVRCAMFRNRNQLLRFKPENGMQILVRARISLYEGRGEFQLIAEHMEEAGDGALLRAYEELKQKLAVEGLFNEESKQELPILPKQIGVITSPTGAAIRDILSVLKRRFPAIPILIYPVPVQGEGAGIHIANAITLANERNDCDVLILARGGGSIEDLWSFNEEIVARTIFQSTLPIVCGVGHEIDFTIADFVADHRAPTPSAAAELLSPDQDEINQSLIQYSNRLQNLIRQLFQKGKQHLAWTNSRLQQQHPGSRLKQHTQRLDELEQRLKRSTAQGIQGKIVHVQHLHTRIQQHTPLHSINNFMQKQDVLQIRLKNATQNLLKKYQHNLARLATSLDTISPLATLDRGYAIVQREKDGKIITNASTAKPGEQIEARLAKGLLLCTIDKVSKN